MLLTRMTPATSESRVVDQPPGEVSGFCVAAHLG